jgi:hypothetical protein
VSLDPSASAVSRQPRGPADNGAVPGLPQVERIQIWPLRDGDRLIVHVDGAAGMSAGGADKLGRHIREVMGLDGLGFEVPVMVVSPGIRVEVIRPS